VQKVAREFAITRMRKERPVGEHGVQLPSAADEHRSWEWCELAESAETAIRLRTTANNGNVLSQTITVPGVANPYVQQYTYDELNRLKIAEETQNSTQTWKQTFTFDRYGNRNFDEVETTTLPKSCMDGSNPVMCAADRKIYNPSVNQNNNRLNASEDYSYDSSGNTTNDPQGRIFKYDGENKQYEVRDSQNNVIGLYFFDGNGKRIKKIVPSTEEVTVFVYDSTGKLSAEYSTRLSQDPKVSFTTSDHLGSPRIKTDENRSVISRNDYHPYGEQVYTTQRIQALGYKPDDIRRRFTTYDRDHETELDFAQARMYSNTLGRFTQVDPISIDRDRLINPQRIGLYVFVRNSPLVLTDPTGKDIYLENDTKEGRRKALLSATATLKDSEKRNVGIRENADGKFELYLKDPSKVDVQKASVGYKFLAGRIADSNLKIGFTLLEKGKSMTGTDGDTYSQRDLAQGAAGVTISSGNGNIQVIVAEGGGANGVRGLTKSGKDVPIAFPEAIVTAHELFAETQKYVKGWERFQKQDDASRKADSQLVIGIENMIRESQGLPLRSGKDHGATLEFEVTVQPEE